MNNIKKIIIRIIAGLMPTTNLRRCVRNCMTVGFGKTHYRGKNNKLVYVGKNGKKHTVRRLPGCHIYFNGQNNYIEIHGPLNALQLNAHLYGNSKIIIQASKYEHRNLKVQGMTNCTLDIGKDFYVNGQLFVEFTENTSVTIGQDCMFSYGITIRTGDGHTIRDAATNEILNPNEDVNIGNHVWVGCNTMILKGVTIPSNCIVGACSLVNKNSMKKMLSWLGHLQQLKSITLSGKDKNSYTKGINSMNPIIGEAFGYICGLCTMISFIPQAIKSIRTRNVSGLSLSMYLIYCTGLVFWILYGIYLKSIQMIICDVITLFFSGIILYMIITKKSDKI